MEKGSRKFSIGAVLGRTFTTWLRNFIPFTLLALFVQLPLIVYTATVLADGFTEDEMKTWDMVTTFGPHLLNPILAGLISYGVFQQLNGKRVGMMDCMSVGLRQFVPVLLTGIVVGALVGLGARIFVLIGAVLQCVWWVAVPAAVVERTGVFKSMARSNTLTTGEKGSVFVILLVLGMLLIGVAVLVGNVLGDLEDPAVFAWTVVGVSIIFSVLQAVAAAVGYHDLRVTKEGAAVEDLVAVFS